MRRLTRLDVPPDGRCGPGRRGAVPMVVSLLLGAGLVLGTGMLVVDVGLLHAEHGQLQSGADAASLKIAQACVAEPADCTVAAQEPHAQAYARRNAKDGRADARICLDGVECPAANTASACPAAPVSTGTHHYVQVRTSTRNTDGSTVVPPVFARAVGGGRRSAVQACARVAWGVPASARVLAFGISRCDWERITRRGRVFPGLPALAGPPRRSGLYPVPGLSTLVDDAITINDGVRSSCGDTGDRTSPGGYAWLAGADSRCGRRVTPSTTAGTWIDARHLDTAPAIGCTAALDVARDSRRPVLVPIVDRMIGAVGARPASLRVAGFAAFVVTGFAALPGDPAGTVSTLSGGVPAAAGEVCGRRPCVYGYFTRSIMIRRLPVAFGGTTDYGVTVLGRTG